MKCWLEACHSSVCWNGSDLATGWASQAELSLLVSHNQWYQALLAVNMEALEQFGVSVGVQTDGTVQLLLQFLQSLFRHGSQDYGNSIVSYFNKQSEMIKLLMKLTWTHNLHVTVFAIFGKIHETIHQPKIR